MYAFGFDSPILNIFSYPQRGCKKNLRFFYSPFFYKNPPTHFFKIPFVLPGFAAKKNKKL